MIAQFSDLWESAALANCNYVLEDGGNLWIKDYLLIGKDDVIRCQGFAIRPLQIGLQGKYYSLLVFRKFPRLRQFWLNFSGQVINCGQAFKGQGKDIGNLPIERSVEGVRITLGGDHQLSDLGDIGLDQAGRLAGGKGDR